VGTRQAVHAETIVMDNVGAAECRRLLDIEPARH
jgi:hypothetical protein